MMFETMIDRLLSFFNWQRDMADRRVENLLDRLDARNEDLTLNQYLRSQKRKYQQKWSKLHYENIELKEKLASLEGHDPYQDEQALRLANGQTSTPRPIS